MAIHKKVFLKVYSLSPKGVFPMKYGRMFYLSAAGLLFFTAFAAWNTMAIGAYGDKGTDPALEP